MMHTNGRTGLWTSCRGLILAILFAAAAVLAPVGAARAQNGACCDISGNCVMTDQCTCQLQGGDWYGVGSPCPSGCPAAGACCTANGCTTVLPGLCASLSGTFLSGQPCPVAICAPQTTGACCCRQSICLTTDQDLCTFMNGVFIANQTCTNVNPCVGACCGPASGQCQLLPQTQCVQPGQTWIGGSTCNPNPCVPSGQVACCINGSCTVVSLCQCAFQNGLPFPNQPCVAAQCVSAVPGACCTVNGVCVQTNATVCTQYLGGTSFIAGGPCPMPGCNNAPGIACCCQNNCFTTDAKLCQAAQGTVMPAGTTCNPNPCFGACCDPNTGNCAAPVTQQQCGAAGTTGIYLPGVLSCTPNPCTGACCDPSTGNCFSSIPSQCAAPLQFLGVGSACTAANCPPPVGACCDIFTGQCIPITGNQCPNPSDIYMGPNTTCTPNPCVVCCDPQTGSCMPAGVNGTPGCPSNWIQIAGLSCTPNPCPPVTGACCRTSATGLPGGCQTGVTAANCQAPDLWLGPGSTCTPNKCPGACCNPQTGVCVFTGASQCPFPAPPPFLYLVSCTPNPCPQPPPTGACCNPNTGACQVVAATACPTSFIWLGANTTCQPNPCKKCCDPNTGNCFPVPTTGCQPFNTIVATSCTPNPCPPPTPSGACCFVTGVCAVVPATQCPAPNIYLGNGTVCAPNSCLRCCNPITGGCTPPIIILNQAVCFTGSFLVFGTTCTPNPCPPPGACCKPNGQCVQSIQTNCQGVWLGAGSVCQPNTCFRCCLNGTCYTPFIFFNQAVCIGGPGASIAIATSCTPNPCPQPVGACCVGPKYGCQPTGNTCLQTTQANCIAQGGTWKGVTPCQSPAGNYVACCKANFNGIGGVNVADIFAFLSAWFAQFGMSGTNPPLTADFDCNGTVNVGDLFAFLSAYFAGCF